MKCQKKYPRVLTNNLGCDLYGWDSGGDYVSVPQFPQAIFPGGERWVLEEFVVDCHVFVDELGEGIEELAINTCDERGVGSGLW